MTGFTRRPLLLAGATAGLFARGARAQAYPTRPVRMIVPFPPGGPTGVLARIIGDAMAEPLGQTVVIDNRGGAGGTIGAQAAAQAAPDGYSVFFGTAGTHGINSALYQRLPYDPVADFAAAVLLATSTNVLIVGAATPWRTLAEFLAAAKARPGTISVAHGGNGTSVHMTVELLRMTAGIDVTPIPYRGGGPALTDLIGGQVPAMVDGLPAAMPHIREGRVRALAVSSAARSPVAPEVPAFAETIPGFEALAWWGLFVPRGTPPDAIAALNTAANRALATPALAARLRDLGAEPGGGPPQQFEAIVAAELAKWPPVVRATGARPD
jgi:tripartite-type tricarboxylate transporter receptor subunit TctC